ncbi:hypothetical protein [Taibaiella koreensis]|uniref:hypothetical protein n=1 Tax=Taibaiella koreensis TaxID=1268548 RepID=UPI000E59EAF6|nr:hypothetical protein [Taibaiella koreensis]
MNKAEQIRELARLHKDQLPLNFQFMEIIELEAERKKLTYTGKSLLSARHPFHIQVKKPCKALIRIL